MIKLNKQLRTIVASVLFTATIVSAQSYTLISQGKSIDASGEESPYQQASYANDGDLTTRWSSLHNDYEWIAVDLGSDQSVDKIVLNWEDAYATEYHIFVVQDGAPSWGTPTLIQKNSNGGIDEYTQSFGTGRYVVIQGFKRAWINGNQYGISLYELEVYSKNSKEVLWMGEKAQYPTTVVEGEAFYHTTLQQSFIYNNGLWELFSIGEKGEKGDTGEKGDQGVAGNDGIDGIDGIDGTNGTDGIDGAKGDKGDQGVAGRGGIDGTNGTDGIDGAKGDKGDQGLAGKDGIDGTNGTDGIDGAKGTNGVDGANGTNGVDGVNGTNGVDGAKGTNGVDGANGTNGVDGANGTNGVDGVNGTNGVDGAKGDNGTSIEWLGSFSHYPASPSLNQSFYWNRVGISCVWDGDSWEILSRDGGVTVTDCSEPTSGTFVDARDAQEYNWVRIGSQNWMTANLNYDATNSSCYDNNSANCDTYGRLYDWTTAMNGALSSPSIPSAVQGVCPDGWHLPSTPEWNVFESYVLANNAGTGSGKSLRTTSGWNNDWNGTDEFGFSALPAGYFSAQLGNLTMWHTATELRPTNITLMNIWYSTTMTDRLNHGSGGKTTKVSVRCMQN